MPAPSASAQTRLGVTATPSKNYASFSGKTESTGDAGESENYYFNILGTR